MGQKERDAGSPEGAVKWPPPNPKMRPDPRSWVWISSIPKYVEPKGRWNAAGGWIEKK